MTPAATPVAAVHPGTWVHYNAQILVAVAAVQCAAHSLHRMLRKAATAAALFVLCSVDAAVVAEGSWVPHATASCCSVAHGHGYTIPPILVGNATLVLVSERVYVSACDKSSVPLPSHFRPGAVAYSLGLTLRAWKLNGSLTVLNPAAAHNHNRVSHSHNLRLW
jgi:hypothetical protein